MRTPAAEIARTFAVSAQLELFPRYNIAPTQPVAAVRAIPTTSRAAPATAARELTLLRWGLVPSWAGDPSVGNRMINARSETVATKPSFRRAFADRRCLIVADGFYEWQRQGARKQPLWIHRRDGGLFAFAGLWERWAPAGLETCTILTQAASDFIRPVHDRMPVVLPPDRWDAWLDPGLRDPAALVALMAETDLEDWSLDPVGAGVNNPRFDAPECLRPA